MCLVIGSRSSLAASSAAVAVAISSPPTAARSRADRHVTDLSRYTASIDAVSNAKPACEKTSGSAATGGRAIFAWPMTTMDDSGLPIVPFAR
jgi:hypothetical protein